MPWKTVAAVKHKAPSLLLRTAWRALPRPVRRTLVTLGVGLHGDVTVRWRSAIHHRLRCPARRALWHREAEVRQESRAFQAKSRFMTQTVARSATIPPPPQARCLVFRHVHAVQPFLVPPPPPLRSSTSQSLSQVQTCHWRPAGELVLSSEAALHQRPLSNTRPPHHQNSVGTCCVRCVAQ